MEELLGGIEIEQRCVRIDIRIFEQQHGRLHNIGPTEVAKANAQIRVAHGYVFKQYRPGIGGRAVFDPGHAGLEQDGLVVFQADLIDRVHQMKIVWIKALHGRAQLEASEMQFCEGLFQNLDGVGALRVYAGKANQTLRL